jgi:radical SAM superfamily enzyme YgiQ (UPF0313 family)
MKTLFVNPLSFAKFDGGASARYQATREITSFWYPVWLAYPAGLVPKSRLLDAPAQGISPDDTVAIAQDYEFVVLYTSTAGFASDIRLAERIKARTPGIKIAFVGPHVTARAEASLQASSAVDFVVCGEFDHPVAEVRRCRELFPQAREIFLDDDTFPWAKARTLDICQAFKPLKCMWSCNSRVHTDYETLKAMREAGLRLLVVGFESGDPTILKHIKKGATIEQAYTFMKHCKQLGIVVHGDFQIGLPGETPETIERTMQYAMKLDPETIQVSISHPYPGTEFYNYVVQHGYLTNDEMIDELSHQLPNISYPGLDRQYMVEMFERFYDRYYFRPKVIFHILRRAAFDRDKRQRLYYEAKEFLQLCAKRQAFARTRRARQTPETAGEASQH